VITLFAGVWLDAHRRRPTLIAANAGRVVLLALVPLLSWLGVLAMIDLYSITFLVGLLSAVFDVAYLVYLPALVEQGRLVEANAKLQASYSAAQIAGPGLGGILVQLLTAPVAILADAASYVVAAVSVAWIRRPEAAPAAERPATSTLSEIRVGFLYTLRDRLLLPLAAESAFFNLFERVILTLYLLYGVRSLHMSAGLLGLILATGGVGALAGTFVAGPAGRLLGTGRTLVVSMLLASAALGLVPAAGGSRWAAVTALVAGFVLYGFGLTVFNVHAVSLRQIIVHGSLLGRVTATYRFVSFGTIPLGALLGGFLGFAIGVRAAMGLAVAALVAGGLAFAATPVWAAGRVAGRPTAPAPEGPRADD
jgi:MFS family permease